MRTLVIKNVYLNEILSGEKTTEYRDVKSYYKWLGTLETPCKILLKNRYINPTRLAVIKIEKIEKEDGEGFEVYALRISEKEEIKKEDFEKFLA